MIYGNHFLKWKSERQKKKDKILPINWQFDRSSKINHYINMHPYVCISYIYVYISKYMCVCAFIVIWFIAKLISQQIHLKKICIISYEKFLFNAWKSIFLKWVLLLGIKTTAKFWSYSLLFLTIFSLSFIFIWSIYQFQPYMSQNILPCNRG